MAQPEILAAYLSASTGKKYQIIKGKDGVVYCECFGWKNRKNCKHLLDFTANGARGASEVFNTLDSRTVFTTPNAPPAKTGDKDMDIAIQKAVQLMNGGH